MMEKRKHVRISLETEIWLGQDGIFTRTTERLRDLSEGGAFIESREVFAVGSVLSLRFKLPGARELISCLRTKPARQGRHGSRVPGCFFPGPKPDQAGRRGTDLPHALGAVWSLAEPNQGEKLLPSPLCGSLRPYADFVLVSVATVSVGDHRPLVLAVGFC